MTVTGWSVAVLAAVACIAWASSPPGGAAAGGGARPDLAGAAAVAQALEQPQGIWRVGLDQRYCTGGASLLLSLAVAPFVTTAAGAPAVIQRAAAICSMAASVLVFIIVLLVLGQGSSTSERDSHGCCPRWLPALVGAVLAFLPPATLSGNPAGMAHASAALLAAVVIALYAWSLRACSTALAVAASLALFLCVYTGAEWAVLFMAGMVIAHIVDAGTRQGWRACLSAGVTIAGPVMLGILWCQDWLPGYHNTTVKALLLNMGGVAVLIVWLGWIQRPDPVVRRTLAFVCPAAALLLLWLSANGNGAAVLAALLQCSHTPRCAFAALPLGSRADLVALAARMLLVLPGALMLARQWRGLIALLIVLLALVPAMTPPGGTLLAVLHVLTAVIGGCGVQQIMRWVDRERR